MTPVRFQSQNSAGHARGNPQSSAEVPALPRRSRRRLEGFRPNPAARLLDQCREVLRFHHFSYRTEQSYVDWIRRFIVFHNKRHPKEMGQMEIGRFLSHLAVAGQVSASTQNQALHALLFLYHDVLGTDPGWLDDFARAKRPQRLPEVLSREEVKLVLGQMTPPYSVVSGLLYGAGLRLMEALRLRVKDVDFHRGQIVVHDGKGAKDRLGRRSRESGCGARWIEGNEKGPRISRRARMGHLGKGYSRGLSYHRVAPPAVDGYGEGHSRGLSYHRVAPPAVGDYGEGHSRGLSYHRVAPPAVGGYGEGHSRGLSCHRVAPPAVDGYGEGHSRGFLCRLRIGAARL